jgi:hypothetical protein
MGMLARVHKVDEAIATVYPAVDDHMDVCQRVCIHHAEGDGLGAAEDPHVEAPLESGGKPVEVDIHWKSLMPEFDAQVMGHFAP